VRLSSRILRPNPFGVAGSFNQWQPEAQGAAATEVGIGGRDKLGPGTYEYCLVVDGQWMPDPLARENDGQSFRREKLILIVASPPTAAHLADAKNFTG